MTELPWLRSRAYGPLDVEKVTEYLETEGQPAAFILITRSQREQDALMNNYPRGSFEAFERTLQQSPDFRVVYQNDGSRVYRFVKVGRPR